MPKIKEVYEYNNGSWANGTPIGADASNVDVALSDSTSTKDLQSVLGNVSVSDPSMKTQLTGKVNASGGDIKDTVVSVLDPASETDTSEDIDGTDVVVAAGESQTTMWSKFNMFRKRVSNKFSNFLISSVEDVLEPSDTKTYSQAALNSYFADVIGYKTDADVATVGSVADQLSTLNNNAIKDGYVSGRIATTGDWDSTLCSFSVPYKGAYLLIGTHTNSGVETKTVIWFENLTTSAYLGVAVRYTPFWGGGYCFVWKADLNAGHTVGLRVRTPSANTDSWGYLHYIYLHSL